MKSVIVTGARGGIGRVVCEHFHNANYNVIGVDKERIRNAQYSTVQFDITNIMNIPEDAERFYKSIEDISDGSVCAIINNAAIQIIKPFSEINITDWLKTFEINLFAPFFLVQRFMRTLEQNRGSVVNISSIHSRLTKKNFSEYSTSKAALVGMTRALALDLAPSIRVNSIIPAATDTPMLRDGFIDNPELFDELATYHPLKRIAKPIEVADVALFLCEDRSSFITGSSIWVDGGIGGVLSDPIVAR